MEYYSCRKNVNNQYLTNVFCVAFEYGLNLPVYQVNYKEKEDYNQPVDTNVDAFICFGKGSATCGKTGTSETGMRTIMKIPGTVVNCFLDNSNTNHTFIGHLYS